MTDLKKAAQQALEALESLFSGQVDPERGQRCGNAVLALRAALAQQEQEPLSVEDLARALVASRVIDAAAIDDPEGYDDGVMLERVRAAYRRLV
jgi:hypothetical protein